MCWKSNLTIDSNCQGAITALGFQLVRLLVRDMDVSVASWKLSSKPSAVTVQAERSHFGVSAQLDITLSRFKSSHLGQSHENRHDIEIIYIYINIYYNIMLNYVFHCDCMYVPLSCHVLLVSCSFYSPTVSNSTFCGQDLELVSKVQLVMSRRTLRRAAFRLVLIRR